MKVAAIQMVSTPQPAQNFAAAQRLMLQAAQQGAELLLLPEYWSVMGMQEQDKLVLAERPGQGQMQDFLSRQARELGVWIIGGTMPMASDDPGKVLNTTLVFDPQGRKAARYDKIHLFGFTRGDESYQESRTITPGSAVACFDAGFGKIGLSVCYDLRFPELYRAMGSCALIVVPAAFTYTTGQAHWEILLRARAIENQCYVLAAAQGGKHQNGRRTWGHSMLIDPWGEVLAVLEEGEGIVAGELKLDFMAQVRENLPALKHRVLG